MLRPLFFTLVLALAATASPAGAAANISVNGSTTVLPIMQTMVETYMKKNPEVAITISGGGSGNGIKALLDKGADIAMSSRELKESELKLAGERSITLRPVAIALDAVLPIVHPENPVTGLTRAELRGIFTGHIKNWKEVGGPDKAIVIVSRDTSSGTYEAWNEMIMGGEKVAPSALLSASSGAVVQMLSNNRYAIGYDSYGYLNPGIKALRVDGIEGRPETAANGSYPLSRKLWIITAGEPQGAAAAFITFILGPEGQAIVAKSGAVPVK